MSPLDDDPRVLAVCAHASWHTIEHHRQVTSTQDVALGRLRNGAAAGLVVVADLQSHGRGRAGRGWREHTGAHGEPTNLAVTATWQPPTGADVSTVPLAAGLAVASALRSAGAPPALKWPNDVLVDDRKAAGILVERHQVAGADVLLIGCGIDVDWRGVPRDPEASQWTSLAEATGGEVDRGRLLADVLGSLDELLATVTASRARVLEAYRRSCVTLGRRVHVDLPGGVRLEGRAVDLTDTGGLVVDSASDGRRVVTVGDVVHVR